MSGMSNHHHRPPTLTDTDWRGRIVARLLPPEIEPAYDQARKPGNRRIDVATLGLNGSTTILGPQDHRLYRENPLDLIPKTNRKRLEEETNTKDRSICFDVFLYLPCTRITASLQMIREANEETSKCLRRLGISMEKKLRMLENTSRKGKSNGGKRGKKQDAPSAVTTVLVSSPDRQSMDIWPQENVLNHQLWSRAMDDAVVVELSNVTSSPVPLQFTCDPPTVIGVQAFDGFNTCLFPGIPTSVQVETAFADRAVIDWFADGNLVCRDASMYIPTTDDVGKTISIMITPIREGDHDGEGCQEAYEFSRPVEPDVPRNTLLEIRPEWTNDRDKTDLRVISYNILADQNAFSATGRMLFYPYVQSEILDKRRRLPLILHELLAYDADVLCLQEVDESVYYSLLEPILTQKPYNYQGYFSCKTSGGREGSAMFWSLDRFEKADESDFQTYKIGNLVKRLIDEDEDVDPEWKDVVTSIRELFVERPDVAEVLLERVGHVAQLARLKSRDPNEGEVLVSNTHLFFHPWAQHIRLLQCFSICYEISQRQKRDGVNNNVPFIFCGDFNSSFPYCGSLLTKAFVTGGSEQVHRHLNTFKWDKTERSNVAEWRESPTRFPDLSFPKSFSKIESGYPEDVEFTHYIGGFHAALDYVTFTPSHFRLARPSAPLPTEEQVTEHVAMPSEKFPSDHVSLVCDLVWKGKSDDGMRN